jgi:hypothetical protein
MSGAIRRAAASWRGRAALFSWGILVRSECPCRGLGLVARLVEVRGSERYTFDVCQNPACPSKARFDPRMTAVKKSESKNGPRGKPISEITINDSKELR